MTIAEPAFTLGVEEEYLLVDAETGDLASNPPESLIADCVGALGERVTNEFLQAQVEIGTGVCADIGEARKELRRLRSGVALACGRHGLAPVAASTHPFGDWRQQDYVHKERYEGLAHDMQAVAHRLLICGMHVHEDKPPEVSIRKKDERDSGVCQPPLGKDLRPVRTLPHRVPEGLSGRSSWRRQFCCRAAAGSTRMRLRGTQRP